MHPPHPQARPPANPPAWVAASAWIALSLLTAYGQPSVELGSTRTLWKWTSAEDEQLVDLATTPEDDVVVATWTTQLRLLPNADVEWIVETGLEVTGAVAIDDDGTVLLVGRRKVVADVGMWLGEFSPAGVLRWNREETTEPFREAHTVAIGVDGTRYIGGTQHSSMDNSHGFVEASGPDGTSRWRELVSAVHIRPTVAMRTALVWSQ